MIIYWTLYKSLNSDAIQDAMGKKGSAMPIIPANSGKDKSLLPLE